MKSHRIDVTTAAQAGTRCTNASQNAVVLEPGLKSFYDRSSNTLGRHRYDSYALQAPEHTSKPEDADHREHL